MWSRIVRALMKQPRSSFFARNIDILKGIGCVGCLDAEDESCRRRFTAGILSIKFAGAYPTQTGGSKPRKECPAPYAFIVQHVSICSIFHSFFFIVDLCEYGVNTCLCFSTLCWLILNSHTLISLPFSASVRLPHIEHVATRGTTAARKPKWRLSG